MIHINNSFMDRYLRKLDLGTKASTIPQGLSQQGNH